MAKLLTIGILEIQGGFLEHKIALTKAKKLLSTESQLLIREVRQANHLTSDLDGLIIPGGESTAITIFIRKNNMEQDLINWIANPKHVTMGTCAGMILLSKETENHMIGGKSTIGILDTVVSRNYFGRQDRSFEAKVTLKNQQIIDSVPGLDDSFNGVFIRAPAVTEITSAYVNVLATLTRAGAPEVVVAVEGDNVMALAFHPELTEDVRWHLYFLEKINSVKK